MSDISCCYESLFLYDINTGISNSLQSCKYNTVLSFAVEIDTTQVEQYNLALLTHCIGKSTRDGMGSSFHRRPVIVLRLTNCPGSFESTLMLL